MKKILLTGVSGLLGSNVAFCWRDRYEILGIYHRHPWQLPGIETKQVDLLNEAAVKALLKDYTPDVIVHAAAAVDVDKCEDNPQWAFDGNVVATRHLAEAANPKTKFVYISTDLVYGGEKGQYVETDPVALINFYAKTKFEGERQVLQLSRSLIARSNFFGWNVQDKACFAERVITEARNKTIKGFTDSFFSSLYTFDFSDLLMAAIEKDLVGVYHFGSSTALSRFDFADKLSQELGYGQGLITKSSITNYSFKAKRAPDLSLNTEKLSAALGKPIPTAEQTIKSFVKDYLNKVQLSLQAKM